MTYIDSFVYSVSNLIIILIFFQFPENYSYDFQRRRRNKSKVNKYSKFIYNIYSILYEFVLRIVLLSSITIYQMRIRISFISTR